MIAAVRAAVLLGGSSLIAMLSMLIVAKALAVLVGPYGVGVFGLLQVTTEIAALVVGLGVSVSLVRSLAEPDEPRDLGRTGAAMAAATAVAWTGGGIATIILVAASSWIAVTLLGSAALAPAVLVAALVVPVALAAATNIAALSARRQVGTIAALRSAGAVILMIVTIAAVLGWGLVGSSVGLLAAAIVLWTGSTIALRTRSSPHRPTLAEALRELRPLVRFGVPFAASAIVGTGVQLMIPVVVAVTISTDAAGLYRAATQISAGYLAFIAAAMLADYYPRLAARRDEPAVVVHLIDQQLQLVMFLTVPLILLGLTFSDWIVPTLYSAAFGPAVVILGWQLVGTLLKLPSWTLAFAILARGRSTTYFGVELLGGIVLLSTSLVGMQVFGFAGLGLAVLVTYAIYYAAVWAAVRRDLPLRFTRTQRVLLATVIVVAAIEMLPALGFGWLRQPAMGALAGASILVTVLIGRRGLVSALRARSQRQAAATGAGPR